MGGKQCSICLEPITGEAYLDQCFHKFCYHCILQWAEVLSNQQSNTLLYLQCPLCKMKNASIIHNLVGTTFQRHYISNSPEKSFTMSEAHHLRLRKYSEPPDDACINVQALEYWKQHGNLPNSCWLQCWIGRELQALMQEEDVDIVKHHVLGILESFQRRPKKTYSTSGLESKRAQFKTLICDALRPFVFESSGRFADELEAFLISGLDIASYDESTLRRTSTKHISSCSSGNDLCRRDTSGSYVSPENFMNMKTEQRRMHSFDLLDEDVDLAAESNVGQ